jgi:uncharacterized protein (DUF433 family)
MIARAVYLALADGLTVAGILAACPGITIGEVRRALGYYGRRRMLEVYVGAGGPVWRRRQGR